jgi:hypothetical protein
MIAHAKSAAGTPRPGKNFLRPCADAERLGQLKYMMEHLDVSDAPMTKEHSYQEDPVRVRLTAQEEPSPLTWSCRS